MNYKVVKRVSGLSTCFRQWKAESHCNKLHGYAIEFKITFIAENLDDKNWVKDFGFLKQPLPEDDCIGEIDTFHKWIKELFDHTTIVSWCDPEMDSFMKLEKSGVIDLFKMNGVGCESFAKRVFDFARKTLEDHRVKIYSVECIENENNSAIYTR